MKRIQRRHLNYIRKKPGYRSYSIRSVQGYLDEPVERDPDNLFMFKWEYTFPEPYSEDSVLFIKPYYIGPAIIGGELVDELEERRAMTLVAQSNEGFTAKSVFLWGANLRNPDGGNPPYRLGLATNIPQEFMGSLIIPEDQQVTGFSIVYEIDPQSYFDLS